MKIIIIGCGKIGTAILSSLVGEGHDVVAIDNDRDAIDGLTDLYDTMCVCGNGADSDTLAQAGVAGCELFVAVTNSDELNMLSCFIAGRMGAKHTIARIRTPEYNDASLDFLKRELNLSLAINPEMLAAQEMAHMLKLPAAVNIDTFSDGSFEMVELRLGADSPLNGMKLIDLRRKYQAKFLVCAVQRNDGICIPGGNFTLDAGDRIALTAAPNEIQKLLRMLGIMRRKARNVMILGASRTAFYLARTLLAGGNSVKIIDMDRQRCVEFCSSLPGADMVCGDGARPELLLEEGLASMDAFVALTGSDEENILISIYAASVKVPKVIAKVNRPELAAMAQNLGLDCLISPQKSVSNILSRYARALQNSLGSNVETLYKLMDGRAEALEFNVQSDYPYSSVPLKDMELKPDILIAGIIRGRKTIIPSGDDLIQPGDKVIVLAAGHRLHDLTDITAKAVVKVMSDTVESDVIKPAEPIPTQSPEKPADKAETE